MAEPQAQTTVPEAIAHKKRFHMPEITPESMTYFMTRREGSGGTLALLFIAWKWLLNINPHGELAIYLSMLLAFGVGVWYMWAQLGGVRFAGSESEQNDDKQMPRDARWSRYPMHVIHAMVGLSFIAWILKSFTTVFVESAPMWVADHLIMSWGLLGVMAMFYAIIMIDVNINSEVVATLRRFIGSRTRLNE